MSDVSLCSALCVIDEQLCQDENSLLSFEAICSIHKLMDDDADGKVDTAETDEVRPEHVVHIVDVRWSSLRLTPSLPPPSQFLREDLKDPDSEAKHSSFHRADLLISVKDMWSAWKSSEGEAHKVQESEVHSGRNKN